MPECELALFLQSNQSTLILTAPNKSVSHIRSFQTRLHLAAQRTDRKVIQEEEDMEFQKTQYVESELNLQVFIWLRYLSTDNKEWIELIQI